MNVKINSYKSSLFTLSAKTNSDKHTERIICFKKTGKHDTSDHFSHINNLLKKIINCYKSIESSKKRRDVYLEAFMTEYRDNKSLKVEFIISECVMENGRFSGFLSVPNVIVKSNKISNLESLFGHTENTIFTSLQNAFNNVVVRAIWHSIDICNSNNINLNIARKNSYNLQEVETIFNAINISLVEFKYIESYNLINSIKYCSDLTMSNFVKNAPKAVELLEKSIKLIDKNQFNELIINLIKKCSGITLNHESILGSVDDAIELLNKNKVWLTQDYNELYTQSVTNIFNKLINIHLFNEVLINHGNAINSVTIINKYIQTDSIRIVQAIREYVRGVGLYRRINLPPRLDMMINHQPLEGIAFEVHNFTDGIESTVLYAIKQFLTCEIVTVKPFSIDALYAKFDLISNLDDNARATQSLNTILQIPSYKTKLELALPFLAAFLNFNHSTWENDYATKDSRWIMWLTQSFVEAGNAYPSNNNTISCVKGIYERLFTGFMAMHPIIDYLFVIKNVSTGFEKNIANLLIKEKDNIIIKLKKKNLKGTESDFNIILKEVCIRIIKNKLIMLIHQNLNLMLNKLDDEKLKPLKEFLNNVVNSNKEIILNNTINKLGESISCIEYVQLDKNNSEITLVDYIKNELTNYKK